MADGEFDDNYLSAISDYDGTDNSGDNVITQEVETNNEQFQQQQGTDQQATEQYQQPQLQDTNTEQPNGEQTQQQTQGEQRQQAQQAAPPAGLKRHVSGNFVDGDGNIVDQQGTVIHTRGQSRRLYEDGLRHRRTAEQATARLQQLEQQVRETNYLNGIPQRYNLSNDEVAQALDLQSRIKSGDLLGVAKDIVARAASQGINVSQIVGNNVGDAIEMRAVRQMIDEVRQPMVQQQQAQQQQDASMRQAVSEYTKFVNDNEFAEVHGDVIAQLVKKDGLSHQQAYNQVRTFAATNGLDFSEPLGPQVEARVMQSRQQQQRVQQSQQNNQRRPLPNNQTRNNGVRDLNTQFASPEDDWGSIVRQSMNT